MGGLEDYRVDQRSDPRDAGVHHISIPKGCDSRHRPSGDYVARQRHAGGVQVSALAGRADVMEDISSGKVAHAGTFNSQPVGIAAALATMRYLDSHRDDVYGGLFRLGARLRDGLRAAAADAGVSMLVDGPGPVLQTYLTDLPPVRDYRDFAAMVPEYCAHHGRCRSHGRHLPRGSARAVGTQPA